MNDTIPVTGVADISRGRPNLRAWALRVVDSFDAGYKMRRVVLTADDIAEFEYRPGQALVLMIPGSDGEPVGRRDYTIRAVDRAKGTISIDFVLHGDTPAPNWARAAQPGDMIEARGPRGNTVLRPSADWHLMSGDETCIPAIAHILEEAPAGTKAIVFIEVGGSSAEIAIQTQADVTIHWVHRGDVPPGPGEVMLSAIRGAALPSGNGHAYIIGETSNVRRQRHALLETGFTRERISSEGYWRPGRIGGHDHVED